MTIKEIIKGILEKDVYDLYLWTTWYFRPGKPSCINCIKTRSKISGKAPNCVNCGNPTFTALNKYFKN